MAKGDMKPEEAQLAIAKAAQMKPQVQAMRDRLRKMADDEEKGVQILANAIRRFLHQE
ncbi:MULTISPECIES: hypothetical protein [Azospirillum]|uniref:Uncharacterized protein n=1 Tax=Azospirillum brasilense TaxID=192 RepID=A0ABU4PD02_AZOBR|nr:MULTISPECIES: hypothetical protein [Azospirillum]MDW7553081.1 hypothetical protein [Azospirillum brasilense]MDW7593541.1 hypothetical protein [Azospirillum brasilense]MDW7628400.1 hypothetical protein [Azospirillum brasilense]MDX5955505.1 hypothetical protein [Azospirillum brasilense]TVZ54358.1 hypothetical protein OH82_03415 [Azospirillum brasilense]